MTRTERSPLLIFGATGYTGRALVELACARGWPTHAHIRPASSRAQSAGARFESLGAALESVPWEADAIRDCVARLRPQVVFGLLGTTQKRAQAEGPGNDYAAVDVGMTQMAIDALAQLATETGRATGRATGSAPRFVYLSSLGAREGARGAYLRARVQVEAYLRAKAEASGIEFAIARPSFITGPDRDESRPGERITSVIADAGLGALATLGIRGPRDRYASMRGHELARALLEIGTRDEARDQVFEADALRALAATSEASFEA